jgi:hypothetical protein
MTEQAGSLLFSRTNGSHSKWTVWIEPWAEEFEVASGSSIEIVIRGAPAELAEIDSTPEQVTIYAPSGAFLDITIDGVQQDSASAQIAVPNTRTLGTRGFVDLVFGNAPEARPHGRPVKTGGWRAWLRKLVSTSTT